MNVEQLFNAVASFCAAHPVGCMVAAAAIISFAVGALLF